MSITGNAQFLKLPLSGSVHGRRIKVVATADPGTLLHTGPSETSLTDEIWLHAYNGDAVAHTLTIEWGGNTSPDDMVAYAIPAKTTVLLDLSGCVLVGAATPMTVRGYADVANVISVGGYVNRMQ